MAGMLVERNHAEHSDLQLKQQLEAQIQAWRTELSSLREQRTALEADSPAEAETKHALAALDVHKQRLIWYDQRVCHLLHRPTAHRPSC